MEQELKGEQELGEGKDQKLEGARREGKNSTDSSGKLVCWYDSRSRNSIFSAVD